MLFIFLVYCVRVAMDEDEHVERSDCVEDNIAFSTPLNDEKVDRRKNKRKKHLMKEGADAEKRGICYLSRVPPRMGPTKLRQILSQYGEILRIYLALEGNCVILPLVRRLCDDYLKLLEFKRRRLLSIHHK